MNARLLMSALATLGFAGAAMGSTLTFFGENAGLGEATPLASYPAATGARNSFLAMLTGVGTENFESYATGTGAPLGIAFMGAGTATLNGTGSVATVTPGTTNGVGRYATSGSNYWESESSFSIAFSQPIAAFGFFGIDIGDFNGNVTLTLNLQGGGTQLLLIPNTVNGPGGSVLFYGFVQDGASPLVTGITFGNTQAGVDFFGFDDMTIGSREQVIPLPPAAYTGMALMAGIGACGYIRRRKSS